MVRQPDATMQPTPQDDQLMSKHRVLGFEPQLRLEWRGQDGQNETEQPDHSANLGDSITASTRIRFSVHTGRLSSTSPNLISTVTSSAQPRITSARGRPSIARRRCSVSAVSSFWAVAGTFKRSSAPRQLPPRVQRRPKSSLHLTSGRATPRAHVLYDYSWPLSAPGDPRAIH
jgi:hypothetical protein